MVQGTENKALVLDVVYLFRFEDLYLFKDLDGEELA